MQNIPTCWYILRWVRHIFRVLPDAFYPTRFTRRVLSDAFYPTRFTRRQSVEYRWRWAFWRWGWRWACTFHIFCVDFICVWCLTRTPFPVEYGLNSFISRFLCTVHFKAALQRFTYMIAFNFNQLRDWSLMIGRGLQNGKITGSKLFAPPPLYQDRVKLFTHTHTPF